MTEKRTTPILIAVILCIMTASFVPAKTESIEETDRQRRAEVLRVSSEVFEQLLARYFH